LKITIIIDDILSLGGSQSFAINLSNYLLSLGYQIQLISLKRINNNEKGFNFDVVSLNLESNFLILFNQKKIKSLTKDSDVILNVSGQTFMYFSLIGFNEKYIFRESNQPLDRINSFSFFKKKISTYLYKKFLQKKPNLVLQNHIALNQVKKIYKSNISHRVLFNPCFFQPKKNNTQRIYDLVFASRPTNAKGFDRFLKLMNYSKHGCIYLGSSHSKLKNSKNIRSFGRVENVIDFLSKSKILLLLSRYEGFPNIFHEAIVSGCNIILSKELEWIKNEIPFCKKLVHVVSADDPHMLEAKVEDILSAPKDVGHSLHINQYLDNFSVDTYWKKLINEV
tara:strand:- start:396 stop:1406 length:1011 start_codon:yes stop_codon:yes gene_type:complete